LKSFKRYINEEKAIDYVIENMTYEAYCSILDGNTVTSLHESASDLAKSKGLDYLGFGRWGKNGEVNFKSKDGKLIPYVATSDDSDGNKDKSNDEKVNLSNVAVKLKQHVNDIANDLKVSTESIADAFKQPTTYKFMKSIGFGLKKAGEAALKGVQTLNVGMKATFEEMHKTGALKKLESGAIKIDEALEKYPKLKKIGGAAVAGFLVYQWQHMAFSGDLDDDFDVTAIASALAGDYSIRDVFASPQGVKGLVQLATGIATGVTFPWGKIGPATLTAAAIYTGAKKAKNAVLAKKALDMMKNETQKPA
jgi:hypothetical protein